MQRRLLTVLFAFLLLGMQQEALLHAIGHLGEQLDRPHERGLQIPTADAACAECALLAGGSSAAPNGSVAVPDPVAGSAVLHRAVPSPALETPSFYRSRAPPTIL